MALPAKSGIITTYMAIVACISDVNQVGFMLSQVELIHITIVSSATLIHPQGRIQDFLKGRSESGVDIEGGANRSIVSLKQGVWGAVPPRSYGVFNFG